MKHHCRFSLLFSLIVLAFLAFAGATVAVGQTQSVIYNFGHGNDGQYPEGVVLDGAGNLYGVTQNGGAGVGFGIVFELSSASSGLWTETVLYTFTGGSDGGFPSGGLAIDSNGDLYGLTVYGGKGGHGTAFRLAPNSGGNWTIRVLHNFSGTGSDGGSPQGVLTFDAQGNLYGTAAFGGAYGFGNVFELIPTTSGPWREKTLHDFGSAHDGHTPYAGVVFDTANNLYGTTSAGGANDDGTIFRITPLAGGRWKESVLHSLAGTDGRAPFGRLVLDASSNLYGTTSQGGHGMNGTVFELTLGSHGRWMETVLHSFAGGSDAGIPYAGMIFDTAGNLYGTSTEGGGTACAGGNGCGTVFKLTAGSGGDWTETLVYRFPGTDSADYGSGPFAGLVIDLAGNLYGTTMGAGAFSLGTAFQIAP